MFNGTSRYSSDFQSIIDRTVGIASLPITQLNNDKTAATNEQTALNALDTKMSALQDATTALGTATGPGSYDVSVSDPSVASASVTGDTLEGSYSIEVTDFGAYSASMSSDALTTVTDYSTQGITSADSLTLTAGGKKYTIEPASHSLSDLAAAINTTAGADVQATIVNVGSSDSPDYRLSLQSTKLTDQAIQLNDGSDLLTEQATGRQAAYKVNGSSQVATSDSRTVSLAPGLNVVLTGQSDSGVAAEITVTQRSSDLRSALANFVSAYNDANTELDAQRGTAGGALAGEAVVYQVSSALDRMTIQPGSQGSVQSLSDLGITFDATGKMSFDSFTFLSKSLTDMSGIKQFLGSSSGGGFLQTATDALNSIEDPTTGSVKVAINDASARISSDQTRIDDEQTRIDQMKSDLTDQMAAADALVATLEQQATYLSGVFQAMQIAEQAYK